mgnify:CR=1 FL=1
MGTVKKTEMPQNWMSGNRKLKKPNSMVTTKMTRGGSDRLGAEKKRVERPRGELPSAP